MQKKVIFAIRQIGKPTWFCSFSAAERQAVPSSAKDEDFTGFDPDDEL